jgi:hypothetical protein
MKTVLVALAASLALSSAAFADHDEVLVIINKADQPIGNVTAKPGKVIGFRSVPPGNQREFVLRMPDGVCDTVLTTVLPDGQSFKDKVEVCGGLHFTWGVAID